MTFFKTSALFIGLAALGIACGSDSSNSPDAPVISNGGSRGDAAVVPGTGGATGTGGAIVPSNGGAGGGVVMPDGGGVGGTPGIIDAGIDQATGTGGTGGAGGIDAGIDGGTGGNTTVFTKPVHLQIINAATTGGLDVTGSTAVPYTSCK
jgi:hypothetical protein